MHSELTPALVLLLAGAPVAFGLAWYAWRDRHLPGALPFLCTLMLGALWSIAGAGELLASGLQDKLLWSNLQYVAKAYIPVAWLAVVLDHAGHQAWTNVRRLALLCLLPTVTTMLSWTNALHQLVRTQESLVTSGPLEVVAFSWGFWFWVHMLYSYTLLAVAAVVMISACRSSPPLYRRQPLALLLGSAIPAAVHMGFVFNEQLGIAWDYTPIAITFGGVVAGWGLFRMRLFNLAPVVRHALVEDMSDGVLALDSSHRVVDLNKSAEGLIGKPKRSVLGRPVAEVWEDWSQVTTSYGAETGQAGLRLGDKDTERHYEVKWSPVKRRGESVGRLVVVQDVTHRVITEENLRRRALTDSLTGLPNRVLFMSRVDDAIHHARRRADALFAVMVLDLDRFKLTNDTIGHQAGDVLLQSVAAKLKLCVREADTVARMGGDEFMVLLHGITTGRDLLPVLNRIHEELREPVFFLRHEMVTDASVGVVIWDPSYDDPEDLLRAADTAMYRAKEEGGGCDRVFDEDMHKSLLCTLQAETDFRASLRRREFSLAYQPIVDLRSGSVRSLEALTRWHHPQRGTVYPGEFLPVAESSGLIVALGDMGLEEVCSQISRWRSPGCPAGRLPVSLNISPRQLIQPDFASRVGAILVEWRLPPERLILEITESALIHAPDRSRQVMRVLRDMGIRLCLDNFGAGWSSLRHLSTFPVEELKIDHSLVSGLARGNTEYEVARSLTALAHTLGLEVVGEGAEQSEQWRLLHDIGCDYGQGYYVAGPMGPDELLVFLEDLELGGCERSRPVLPCSTAVAHDATGPGDQSEEEREKAPRPWKVPPPLALDEP